jgi:hypothetical protein
MHPTNSAPGESSPAGSLLPNVALEITRGRARHKRRDVRSAAFLIGSAPDCDLVLGDARFDELHSYLFLSERKVTIRRLGSGPPLSVGDHNVSATTLDDADCVQIGPYEFQVSIRWPQGQQHERTPRGVMGQMNDSLDNDRALERLLRDIERASAAPAVRLFVGEQGAGEKKSSPVPPAPSQIARAFSRKASL